MKSLARLHVWWPNLDKDIATIVQRCNDCQRSQNKPPTGTFAPLGLAKDALAESPHRLRRTVYGKYVPDHRR